MTGLSAKDAADDARARDRILSFLITSIEEDVVGKSDNMKGPKGNVLSCMKQLIANHASDVTIQPCVEAVLNAYHNQSPIFVTKIVRAAFSVMNNGFTEAGDAKSTLTRKLSRYWLNAASKAFERRDYNNLAKSLLENIRSKDKPEPNALLEDLHIKSIAFLRHILEEAAEKVENWDSYIPAIFEHQPMDTFLILATVQKRNQNPKVLAKASDLMAQLVKKSGQDFIEACRLENPRAIRDFRAIAICVRGQPLADFAGAVVQGCRFLSKRPNTAPGVRTALSDVVWDILRLTNGSGCPELQRIKEDLKATHEELSMMPPDRFASHVKSLFPALSNT